MKNHALFSTKDKNKKLKCRLLQFLFVALRVKNVTLDQTTAFHMATTTFTLYQCKNGKI